MKGKIGKDKIGFDMVIVDAMNICRKMEWVFRTLVDSKGRSTGLLYGALNHVRGLKMKFGDGIIFAWDSPPEHKREIDKDYKANRKKMTADKFWEQVRELKVALSLYGVTQYYAPGYEADDIAAKLVHDNSGKKILLVSSDHDWLQMLDDGDHVFVLHENEVKNKAMMERDCELDLGSFVRFKSIIGDKKNNVPGIPGLPKKVAWELAKKFGNLEDMLKFCEKNVEKNRWYGPILEFSGQVKKNFMLIELVDKDYKLESIGMTDDWRKLVSMLRDHDMTKLIERIG